MIIRVKFVLAFIAFISASLPLVAAEEQEDQRYDFTRTLSESIVTEATGNRRVVADLGEVPLSAVGQIAINITNPYGSELVFDSITAGCSCAKASLSSKTIGPRKSETLTVRLTTPRRNESVGVSTYINLKEAGRGRGGVKVVLKYRLEGLFAYKSQMISVQFKKDASSAIAKIPFIFSLPVDIDSLESDLAPNIADAELEPIEEDGVHYLQLTAPIKSIPEQGLTVRLTTTEPIDGASDSAYVVLSPEVPVVITPRTVRFHQTESGSYVANAIVRLNGKEKEAETIAPTVSFGSKSVPATVRKLSAGIFRVSLRLSGERRAELDRLTKESAKVLSAKWRVVGKHSTYEVRSPVSFRDAYLFDVRSGGEVE